MFTKKLLLPFWTIFVLTIFVQSCDVPTTVTPPNVIVETQVDTVYQEPPSTRCIPNDYFETRIAELDREIEIHESAYNDEGADVIGIMFGEAKARAARDELLKIYNMKRRPNVLKAWQTNLGRRRMLNVKNKL